MDKDRIVYKGHLYVVAQDPPEDPLAALDAPAADAPADAPEDTPALGGDAPAEEESPEEVAKKIDESPAAKWHDHLPNVIKDLEVRFNGEKVTLRGAERVTDTDDPDLGFYITGYIHFVNGTPRDIQEQYGNSPLHFEVFVDGDGKLHYQHIKVYTEL